MTAPDRPRSAGRPRRILVFVVIGVVLLVAVGGAVLAIAGGLVHEKACSEGQAPANNAQGGSACFAEGSDLPAGYVWDPRGNFVLRD